MTMGIGYPNRLDAATLSGGSWQAALPLANMQSRYLSQVARSTNDATASTKFTADLASDRVIRSIGLINHNLSLAALVRARARTAGDTMVELNGVTNLAGEYALRVGPAADYRLTIPSNWTEDTWEFACYVIPNFSSTDTSAHVVFEAAKDANDNVRVRWDGAGNWELLITHGGTAKTMTLAMTFAAGDEIFIGADLVSGTATLRIDTNGDNTLETDADATIGALASSSWTLYYGQDRSNANQFEGAVNVLCTNKGTAAPITDRFNAGSGMALVGDDKWLKRHGANLVLHIGGNNGGTAAQVDTFATATDLLAGSAEGRLNFVAASSQDVSYGNVTGLDAATKAWMLLEVEYDTEALDGTTRVIVSRFGTTNDTRQFRIVNRSPDSKFFVGISDGAGVEFSAVDTQSLSAGQRYLYLVRVDLTAGTDAGRLKIDRKLYTAATRQYASSWTSVSPTYSGAAPAAFHTPGSAVNLYLGRQQSGLYWDGKIDTFRWSAGFSLTDAERDAIKINEPDPTLTEHSYAFDGDANDIPGRGVSAINGTVTGATQADDGRHHLGRMERYDKSGQYFLDGIDDEIGHGNYAALDGATLAVFDFTFTIAPSQSRALAARGKIGTDGGWSFRQFAGPDTFRFLVPTSAGDSATYGRVTFSDLGWAVGDKVRMRWEYDGGQASNATRLVLKVQKRDPSLGTWSALSSQALTSFLGTIPAALQTVATNTGITVGDEPASAVNHAITIDRLVIHAGAIPAAFADIHVNDAANNAIWVDYDGDANNDGTTGASNDGTVSGGVLWYDGRKPSGLTNTADEIDRATGTNQVGEGTYGLRLKTAHSGGGFGIAVTSPSITDGRLVFLTAQAREVANGFRLESGSEFVGSNILGEFAVQGTLATAGSAGRKSGTGTTVLRVDSHISTPEAYVDDWQAYALGVVTFTTQLPYIYDTGWVSAYPAAYPSGTYLWEEDVGGDSLTAEQYALAGIDKYPHPWLHIIAEGTLYADARHHLSARYWEFEVDDTANADGYVEIGRAWASPLIKPSLNFRKGAGLGHITASRRNESEGGAFHMDARVRRPVFEGVIDMMDADEALVQWLELMRRAGITEQLLFVYDDADVEHLHRRSFLGYFEELSRLRIPYADWHEVGFHIIGDVA